MHDETNQYYLTGVRVLISGLTDALCINCEIPTLKVRHNVGNYSESCKLILDQLTDEDVKIFMA